MLQSLYEEGLQRITSQKADTRAFFYNLYHSIYKNQPRYHAPLKNNAQVPQQLLNSNYS